MPSNYYWLTEKIGCDIGGCFLDKILGSQMISEMNQGGLHCVKNVNIWSFFWCVFSSIGARYGPEKTQYFDIFRAVLQRLMAGIAVALDKEGCFLSACCNGEVICNLSGKVNPNRVTLTSHLV